jgi:GAF domain-containing protein
MYQLTSVEGAGEAARFCLDAALRAVPCVAGLVHLRDPAMRDMVIVHAQGPRAEQLLQTRTRADALASRAARTGKPAVVTYGSEPGAEKTTCPRHALFDPWSVVLVPVMHGGQLLGLLEMIDPIRPFDEDVQSALGYVATRLGGFLSEHAPNGRTSAG